MYEIMLGRDEEDRKRFGTNGTFLLGKNYVRMGQTTSLSNPILMDAARSHVVLVCGKRGSGKCVTGDTLIPLEDGALVPISQLEGDSRSLFVLNRQLKIGKSEKTAFFKRTVNKLLKINTRSGFELKLTPEHPLLTILGWKDVKYLRVGSRIATPRIMPCFGNQKMNPAEIKILAYLIAEGHTKRPIQFSNTSAEIINEFKEALNILDPNIYLLEFSPGSFKVSTRNFKPKIVSQAKRDSAGKFLGGAKQSKTKIRELLEKHELYRKLAKEKTIPQAIFKLPQEQLSLFLNRLFSCDGSIYKDSKGHGLAWEISYSSSSEPLIKAVKHLLLRFGILSKLRNKTTKCNNKIFNTFELVINAENMMRFIKLIGFFGVKKQKQQQALKESISAVRNPNVDTIPKELWAMYRPDSWVKAGKAFNYLTPKALRSSINYAPSRQKLQLIAMTELNYSLSKLAFSDIFWDEIASIEELNGTFEVYDITVPEHHNFVANNIIIHNSYSLGIISEGLMSLPAEVKQNLAVLIIDTMGIYWTTEYPNTKDKELLREWGLKPEGIVVDIYAPQGYFKPLREKGIPIDYPFSVKPSELSVYDWCDAFSIDLNSEVGVLIARVTEKLGKKDFSIDDIQAGIEKDEQTTTTVKNAALNLFGVAETWGLFSEEGTRFKDLLKPGRITVLDVSCYTETAGRTSVRALVVALVAKKLFAQRMTVRRKEELAMVKSSTTLTEEGEEKKEYPLVWVVVDEVQEFLPVKGRTIATAPLLTLLREGRQPGISLVLATQQPGKIHTDVMTQSDIVISHLITAKADIDALGALMQSYMREDLNKLLQELPRVKGAALAFDDINERMHIMRIRPRISWHGGESPTPLKT